MNEATESMIQIANGAEPASALDVHNLKIRYRSFKKMSIRKNLFKFKRNQTETFEAIKGISFSVPTGQIMGIIGKNGSGKSTLLRTLAGVFSPDEGEVDLHGHSVSLLALGGSFQKALSGKENIMLMGLLMGFTEEQVKAKMKDIIAFADLGDFINKPVSTYSSGMVAKLSFAIATTLETEILLVDEALSVGDAKFKKKSFARMKELIGEKDRTVLIVSHNEKHLAELCDTVMWMHEGEIIKTGPAKEVLVEYLEFMK